MRGFSEVPMKSVSKLPEVPSFLTGWKEIANYLGKGVRTVQRYERELGFPVRRPAGKSHAAVIATKAEVDAWVAASPIRQEFRLSKAETSSQTDSLDDLRKEIARMSELRDEMKSLRLDLRGSVRSLSQSIEGIRHEISNRWELGNKAIRLSASMGSLKMDSRDDEYIVEFPNRNMAPRKPI
jgi:hypothetical protein